MVAKGNIQAVITNTVISTEGIEEHYFYSIGGLIYSGNSLNLPESKVVTSRGFKTSQGKRYVPKTRSVALFQYKGKVLRNNPLFDYGESLMISLGALATFLETSVVLIKDACYLSGKGKTYNIPQPQNINGVLMVDISNPDLRELIGLNYNDRMMRYELA